MAHHLCNGEDHRLVARLIATAGQLGAVHKGFHHHLLRFVEGLGNGGLYLFACLYLGHAEARASQAGLDETGQADLFHHFVVGDGLSLTQKERLSNAHAIGMQILIAGKLVIRKRRRQHATAGVRDAEHVEVALQASVLAWRTMDGDVGEIEFHFLPVQLEAEVVAVYGQRASVVEPHVPVKAVHAHYI